MNCEYTRRLLLNIEGISVAVIGLGFGAHLAEVYAARPNVKRLVLVDQIQERVRWCCDLCKHFSSNEVWEWLYDQAVGHWDDYKTDVIHDPNRYELLSKRILAFAGCVFRSVL